VPLSVTLAILDVIEGPFVAATPVPVDAILVPLFPAGTGNGALLLSLFAMSVVATLDEVPSGVISVLLAVVPAMLVVKEAPFVAAMPVPVDAMLVPLLPPGTGNSALLLSLLATSVVVSGRSVVNVVVDPL
jgi:hypothetical protein